MSFADKLREEVKEVGLVTAYFFVCFNLILFFKKLFLAEYHIQFRGISTAIIGALVAGGCLKVCQPLPAGYPNYWDMLVRSDFKMPSCAQQFG